MAARRRSLFALVMLTMWWLPDAVEAQTQTVLKGGTPLPTGEAGSSRQIQLAVQLSL